ncbi:MAG TPA: hypothetical protein DER01_21300 [Phycisphaerales bacterium]|nr:hypothetical protein [Phycisphaerales bacterium]|tara:strand:+ start:39 stop:614 length:576 start_codon:yes stop_codon:yes gene_type:complete
MSLGESDGSNYHESMPLPGKIWRHITFGTYNSWLPGDPRGFRDHDHRVHSGGDHRCQPPQGEHDGLHEYAKRHSGKPIVIRKADRLIVLQSIRRKLDSMEHRFVIIASCAMHVHVLVELPDDGKLIRRFVGQLKRTASHALRNVSPGRVWARGGNHEPVVTRAHHRAVYDYLRRHDKAWVWTLKDGVFFNG